ncbi:glycoside hydrolase family 43 protein [Zunongwangia sp. F363]|uniref:Glycoside hydrolase family 43 protein n=1 Tax=Autumnicola tepida TaxID=3075595 RepID=A0ABU3CBD0_9FLAO|nr:glycoside hydrolase family 43 protein [Zunongwangia sp. F363]MDT0643573.1 glycoside hydrolase family 43 protein [Zunongwangia sp. F363]
MKKIALTLFILCCSLSSISQAQEYFQNPILAGWYPDPAITDDGNGNYYMVHSTFAFFPGIPVFHSTDLVNWEPIGNVISRPEQLDLEGFGVSRAIFAPDISYDNGTFYVTCTVVDGKGNFVVTAKDPAGPWSDPVYLPEVKGIDPGLFFDENQTYLVYNSDAPNNEPQYSGHRTIRMVEFDKEKLQVTSGNRILVNGGVDISKKPVWAEGPRIYKENGYYYLMTAEGGTAVNHSEMIYRTKDIDSDLIPYKENPILTQRHLDPNREKPITSAGHADLVQTQNGDWYGVFLAVRPYEDDYYNTGRETFMAPVKWVNEWPVFDLGGENIKYQYPLPEGTHLNKNNFPLNGNFSFRKEFDKDSLGLSWLFLRTPKNRWYSFNNGALKLKTRPETIEGTSNPTFIGHRQQHLTGEASISLDFKPVSKNESAGIVAFQNESHYYYLNKSMENGKSVVELLQGTEDGNKVLAKTEIANTVSPLLLKIEFNKDKYNFYYASAPDEWKILKKDIDAKYLSTKTAGGFVGVTLAMYTTSNGEKSDNSASFNWFEYTGNDEIYNEMD